MYTILNDLIPSVEKLFNYFDNLKTILSIKEPLKVYFDENILIFPNNNADFITKFLLWTPYEEKHHPESSKGTEWTVFETMRRKKQHKINFYPDEWIYGPFKESLQGDLILVPFQGIDFYLKQNDYSSVVFDENSLKEKTKKQREKLEKLKSSMTPDFFNNAPEDIVKEKKINILKMEKEILDFETIIEKTKSCNEHRKLCLEFLD